MNKELTFLGIDSGFGPRNTSAYTIRNNRLLLIDCGYTVFPQIQECTEKLLDKVMSIDVIITHMHADHVGSLSQLALYSYFVLKQPINIITACAEIDNFLSITGVKNWIEIPGASQKVWNQIPGFPAAHYIRHNDFVEFIPTKHCEELDCYGFSAIINGSHIIYTGDTATLKPFIGYLEKDTQFYVDVSISGGAYHLKLKDNLTQLIKLTESGVRVYLMHLDNEKEIRKMIEGTAIRICCDE